MTKPRYKRAISVDENNEFYHPQAVECSVTLNGIELKHCVTANESEGWAEVLIPEEEKDVISHNDSYDQQTVEGFIKIHTPELWVGYNYGQ